MDEKSLTEIESADGNEGESSWVSKGVDFRALRAEMEAKWDSKERQSNQELEKIDRVVSLLTARRYSLSVTSDAVGRLGEEVRPDLEEEFLKDESSAPEMPPPSPVEAHDFDEGVADNVIEVADELPLEHWTPATERLYDDVLYLFESGDLDGALVSLERLLLLGGRNPEVREFLDLNEAKMLRLYERAIGSFGKAPVKERRTETMPMSFLQRPAVARVFNQVDGKITIAGMMEQTEGLSPLEVCAVVNQLRRSRLIVCS